MWNTIIINPLYNTLVWLVTITNGSFGWSVVLLTLLTRIILIPFSIQQYRAQLVQKKLAPLIAKIKQDFPVAEDQNKAIMELYTTHKANPFAGCLPMLIQLPLLIGVYQVFFKDIAENASKLYTGNVIPIQINYWFAGINLLEPSILLAILAGLFQFLQIELSPAFAQPEKSEKSTVVDPNIAMMSSMKYILPVMIGFVSSSLPASMAVYFIISSILSIIQDQILTKTNN
jgi:YidC/Oxa1 family membrane protein insertase